MKALVFLDHDIICRHFVLSGALRRLVETAEVLFVFPDDGGRRVKLDPAALPLGAPFIRLAIDAARQQHWRWLLFADQLKFRAGDHERALRRFRRHALGWKAATLLTAATLPGVESVFRWWVKRRLAERPNHLLDELLARERPDVVIHPSVLEGVFINDLIDACRRAATPSVVVMNSWDNPSTKRAVVGQPDWLLVWGPQTCEHAVRFVGMDRAHVLPFGAAQFDVFRDAARLDRRALAQRHGFPPERPIALFAGANTQTDEFGTIERLDAAIEAGRLDLGVLYRPHPWGGCGIGGERFLDHAFRHVRIDEQLRAALPQIVRGSAQGFTLPDYRETHDLLSAIDIVVSPLSTIVVEAALHAKPVICFLPRAADESTRTIRAIPLHHFDEFFAVPDVKIAHSADELLGALAAAARPDEIAARGARLQTAMARFVASFDEPWGERFVAFLRADVLRPKSAA